MDTKYKSHSFVKLWIATDYTVYKEVYNITNKIIGIK